VFVDYAPDVGVVLIDKFIQSRGRVPQQREVKKVGAESVDVDCFYRAESDGLERTMWVGYREVALYRIMVAQTL
jgi:hypothetical protein